MNQETACLLSKSHGYSSMEYLAIFLAMEHPRSDHRSLEPPGLVTRKVSAIEPTLKDPFPLRNMYWTDIGLWKLMEIVKKHTVFAMGSSQMSDTPFQGYSYVMLCHCISLVSTLAIPKLDVDVCELYI